MQALVSSRYELFTGIEKCSHPDRERAKVTNFLEMVSFLPFDKSAAIESARIRATLEETGRTIGPYDLLIAGQAISMQLVLVTNNVSEFSRVTDLSCEDWQTP